MARPWFEGRKQRGTEIQDAEGPKEVGQLALIRVRVMTARGRHPALTTTQRRERCDGRVKEPTGTRHNVTEQSREGLVHTEMLGRAGREDEDLSRETEKLTVKQRGARCVTRRRRGGGLLSGPLGEDDRWAVEERYEGREEHEGEREEKPDDARKEDIAAFVVSHCHRRGRACTVMYRI